MSWTYFTTSGSYSVRISTASMPRFVHTSRIVSASLPGRRDLSREHRDPLRVDDQHVLQVCGVLLDEGLRGREEQDRPAAGPEDLRDDPGRDHGLPHPRREDDQGRTLQGGPGDVPLVLPVLDRVPPDQRVVHEHATPSGGAGMNLCTGSANVAAELAGLRMVDEDHDHDERDPQHDDPDDVLLDPAEA